MRVEYITSGNVTTGVRYIILSVMEHDAGKYSCTATNKFGSDTKYLTLNVTLDNGSGGGGSGEANEAKLVVIKILFQGPKADRDLALCFF